MTNATDWEQTLEVKAKGPDDYSFKGFRRPSDCPSAFNLKMVHVMPLIEPDQLHAEASNLENRTKWDRALPGYELLERDTEK